MTSNSPFHNSPVASTIKAWTDGCQIIPCSQSVMAASTKAALLITDSIGRDLVASRTWQLQCFPGLATPRLLDMLINRRIPLHPGLRLIVIHVGTNDADEGPKNHNRQTIAQIAENCSAIRDELQQQVSGVRVMWSSILPRPRDWTRSYRRTNLINLELQARFGKDYLNSFKPFWRGARHLDVPSCGTADQLLFAEDGLHLSQRGSYTFQGLLEVCIVSRLFTNPSYRRRRRRRRN